MSMDQKAVLPSASDFEKRAINIRLATDELRAFRQKGERLLNSIGKLRSANKVLYQEVCADMDNARKLLTNARKGLQTLCFPNEMTIVDHNDLKSLPQKVQDVAELWKQYNALHDQLLDIKDEVELKSGQKSSVQIVCETNNDIGYLIDKFNALTLQYNECDRRRKLLQLSQGQKTAEDCGEEYHEWLREVTKDLEPIDTEFDPETVYSCRSGSDILSSTTVSETKSLSFGDFSQICKEEEPARPAVVFEDTSESSKARHSFSQLIRDMSKYFHDNRVFAFDEPDETDANHVPPDNESEKVDDLNSTLVPETTQVTDDVKSLETLLNDAKLKDPITTSACVVTNASAEALIDQSLNPRVSFFGLPKERSFSSTSGQTFTIPSTITVGTSGKISSTTSFFGNSRSDSSNWKTPVSTTPLLTTETMQRGFLGDFASGNAAAIGSGALGSTSCPNIFPMASSTTQIFGSQNTGSMITSVEPFSTNEQISEGELSSSTATTDTTTQSSSLAIAKNQNFLIGSPGKHGVRDVPTSLNLFSPKATMESSVSDESKRADQSEHQAQTAVLTAPLMASAASTLPSFTFNQQKPIIPAGSFIFEKPASIATETTPSKIFSVFSNSESVFGRSSQLESPPGKAISTSAQVIKSESRSPNQVTVGLFGTLASSNFFDEQASQVQTTAQSNSGSATSTTITEPTKILSPTEGLFTSATPIIYDQQDAEVKTTQSTFGLGTSISTSAFKSDTTTPITDNISGQSSNSPLVPSSTKGLISGSSMTQQSPSQLVTPTTIGIFGNPTVTSFNKMSQSPTTTIQSLHGSISPSSSSSSLTTQPNSEILGSLATTSTLPQFSATVKCQSVGIFGTASQTNSLLYGQSQSTPGSVSAISSISGGFIGTATAPSSPFGQPAQSPLFGQSASGSIFGSTTTAIAVSSTNVEPFSAVTTVNSTVQSAQTPLFGQATSQSMFGSATTTNASSVSPFGQPAQTPLFGQSTSGSIFGSTTTASAVSSTNVEPFSAITTANSTVQSAQTSLFGQRTSASMFGSPSTISSNSTSSFGQPAQTALFGQAPSGSIFGSTATTNLAAAPGGGSLFGQSAQTPLFGRPPTGSIFGFTTTTIAASSTNVEPFSTSNTANSAVQPAQNPVFGQPTSGSIFGSTATTNVAAPPGGGSLFGQSAQTPLFGRPTSGSIFGSATTTSTTNSASPFGQSAQTPLFGRPTSGSIFGSATTTSTTNSASPFGQSVQTPLFGRPTSGSIFGSATTTSTTNAASPFGQSAQTSLFGRPTSGSIFGPTTTTSAVPSPGSGFFSKVTTANSASPFGQSAQTSLFGQVTSGSIFGSTATTCTSSANVFGQPAQTSLFGQPTSGSIFGSNATTSAASAGLFGQPTQTSLFGQRTSGSIFGCAPTISSNSASPFGQPAQTSLFGQVTNASIFGSTATTNLAASTAGGGLFGRSAQTPLFGRPTSGSIFGSVTSSSPHQLFGANPNRSDGLFGAATTVATGLFGQPAQNQNVPQSLFGSGVPITTTQELSFGALAQQGSGLGRSPNPKFTGSSFMIPRK
ncbi:hypothetical protein ACOME3_001798 [Neoechinorhynchus agilis]